MTDKIATLTFPGLESLLELPIYTPTLGQDVVDIASLGKQKIFTHDPGFTATSACESKITFIDGDEGTLLYRGYPIDQLAEQSNFLEVCYLLMHGELPTQNQQTDFQQTLVDHMAIEEQVSDIFQGFRQEAHPMAMLMGAISALSALYNETVDIHNAADRELAAMRLIAKIPTVSAMCYRHGQGQAFVAPQAGLSYTENVLNMMFETSNQVLAKALDKIFILHADHEQNASTSTVRLAGSTGTNPYAAIVAGIAALWGPAHGGANEACLSMLKEIGDMSRVPMFIERAKDKNDPFLLMGFGHRVYKNYDPRAKVMRQTCYEVLEEVGVHDSPLLKLAMELERIALEDPYFVERKLYPNVDFYSGITLSAIGIPTNLFTVMFALARTVGWITQWNEMMSSPYRIGRPRQLYTGVDRRNFVAMGDRH